MSVEVPDYPARAAPVRILLFSDLHVHGPNMPPARVERIVDQINALHPDVIVAAGDFLGNSRIGRDYPIVEAIAPLRRLKSSFGVFAVLGNNDYLAGAAAVKRALEAVGIRVLRNEATAAGPLAIGGMDGRLYSYEGFVAARRQTFEALDRTPGVKLLIAHRPDEFVTAPLSVRLVLAGHTHCGQIVLPYLGPMETGSDYGSKYLCGVHREGSRLLVVTSGLGTSYVPLRIGAPPDVWMVTVQGPRR